MKNGLAGLVVFGIGLATFMAVLFIKYAIVVGLGGSIVTSGIKAMSHDCGKTYMVESLPLVSGNFFCSK